MVKRLWEELPHCAGRWIRVKKPGYISYGRLQEVYSDDGVMHFNCKWMIDYNDGVEGMPRLNALAVRLYAEKICADNLRSSEDRLVIMMDQTIVTIYAEGFDPFKNF